MTDIYDLIAIGAGPAGESATELASFFGYRSAVIEKVPARRNGNDKRWCSNEDTSRSRALLLGLL